jgi:hypothetical protein
MSAVRQSVHGGVRQALVGEECHPVARRAVGSDDDRASLVALGDDLVKVLGLCHGQGPYLLELVRYIHLNPVRARLAKSLADLSIFLYSGHAALLVNNPPDWQDVGEVLAGFDRDMVIGRQRYDSYLVEGLGLGKHHR